MSKGNLSIDPLLDIGEVAIIMKKALRTIRENCADGRFSGASKDSLGSWLIPLSSLSPIAQARYWAKNLKNAPGGWKEEDMRQLPEEEIQALWLFFEESSEKLKQRAYRDAEACQAWQIMKAQGVHFQVALEQMAQEFGLKPSTIYEKISRIKGYEPTHWPALLIGQWRGENAKRGYWCHDAWRCFLREATTPGRKVKTAWEYTKRQAAKNGWGEIPSYDTAKSHLKKIPHDVITLLKEGEKALKVKSPTLDRKYDHPLHYEWSMDGRRADLVVIDREGKYGERGRTFRPWIYAYEETRSRVLLGYAIGTALDADLLRNAFLDALKTTDRIIPRCVGPDNGMEGAAKEITGGAPWRWRGKKKEDEIIGLFPMLDIEINWKTVAHGQSKPLERLFRTLAQQVETKYEFKGAFCGSSPEKRPEEWDKNKAIPVELFEQILKEEIDAYNRSPHRGNNMRGKSPLQVYEELSKQPGYIASRISMPQLRICAYSAVEITIRKNATFTILGASYWSEGTAKLAPGKGYYARYNPRDLGDTVYVYRKEKLLCEATRKELTSFNDKPAGKRISKERNAYNKSVKQTANALLKLQNSESREFIKKISEEIKPESIDKETDEILAKPQVIEMVNSKAEIPLDKKTVKELEREQLKREVKQIKEKVEPSMTELYKQRALGINKN
ncbi:MAG: hypothetical protein FCKEOINB_01506 [Nitrosomonas sp.]|nr:hypothetical protein [Nitrosomonas sp.]